MIEPKNLLTGLQRLIKKLEDDLRRRCKEMLEVDARVRAEYDRAKRGERTAAAYEVWRDEFITQAAVAWALGCVFVRFIEDNNLVKTPSLSGPTKPDNRLQEARDQHTLYFRRHPTHSDREYLESVFRETARLPAVKDIFDECHNPLWLLGVSGDGATMLIEFWQQVDPATGDLVHDFTDPELNTRFLGDLYQDLSEAARKKYALLQTPIFVEEFILDRTLTPAINEFGFQNVRLIDPTCGSGHFLLGAFERLIRLWQKYESGTLPRKLAQNALNGVYGVDLNPFAVAIARFRLLIAALKACEETTLENAPGFEINLAVGDSLLHGEPPSGSADQLLMTWHPLAHYYQAEDEASLDRILQRGHYHAVVGNPPYITVKDAKLNAQYRERFGSCHMKYSLAVPFMERFFDLALTGNNGGRMESAGYVGMITANSFMKREFGKKLIETYIPRWDLTHVLDTSSAYIPGHGTPTVILFGRNQKPVIGAIRIAMGIKGESVTPADPAQGLVWTAIVKQLDQPGSQSEFISVSDAVRESFHSHPWSIGGGGAAELKGFLNEASETILDDLIESIGFMAITGEDDAYVAPSHVWHKLKIPSQAFVVGDLVRDWQVTPEDRIAFMYVQGKGDMALCPFQTLGSLHTLLWGVRTNLRKRLMFGKYPEDSGLSWYEYRFFAKERYRTSRSISFAEVASHNHFVLDRGGKIFKQTAPVIKLPAGATEGEHLVLLAYLNSSTACFWMKQVAHQKQMTGGDGIRIESRAKVPYQFSGTQLGQLPIPEKYFSDRLRERLLALGRKADECANQMSQLTASAAIAQALNDKVPIKQLWDNYTCRRVQLRSQLIFWQEEIDFTVYCLFGLADESSLSNRDDPYEAPMDAGERPFCIIAGKNEEGFPVPTDIPQHWPDELRALWRKRIDAVNASSELKLIEDPHYKRRWIGRQGLFNHTRNTNELAEACSEWMLDRLEDVRYWPEVALTSTAKLADRVRADAELIQVAEMYRGRTDFDLTKLVTELVAAEAVPFLPVFRYKPSGLEKRALWERTWELQRQEDKVREAIEEEYRQQIAGKPDSKLKLEDFEPLFRERVAEAVGEIPAPPKYASKDFQSTAYWRLRGKLDAPKERFISYPKCERDTDTSPVIAWAGWDHLQQARGLAGYYELMRTSEGWSPERLTPLLAGLLELLPWLKQWHNELDPAYGIGMGDFFESFVEGEARTMGKTVEAIKNWKP